jgi:bifunctional DNase/RNase
LIIREGERKKTVAEEVHTLKDVKIALSNKIKKKVSMNVLKSIILSSQKKLMYNTIVTEEEKNTEEIKSDISNNLSNKTSNGNAINSQ